MIIDRFNSDTLQVLFICDHIVQAIVQYRQHHTPYSARICHGSGCVSNGTETNVRRHQAANLSKRILLISFSIINLAHRYAKGYQKLCRVISMMSYFGLREWQYQNSNIDQLSTILRNQYRNGYNDKDPHKTHLKHPDLEFDMRTINWNDYFYHYLPGIKKYFFKEKLTGNERCKKHYARLQMVHLLLKSSFHLLLVYLSGNVIWKLLLKFILS